MKFFYARTSTKEQDLSRQLLQARELGITKENEDLFVDQQTGTNFNRKGFQDLKAILKARNLDSNKNDVLYVAELDRFGRDFTEIRKNIQEIEGYGVKIIFMDIPLIETGDSATDKLLREQFITVLSYVAQKETEKRKQRQRQGYDALSRNEEGKMISNKTGKVIGRPKEGLPKEFPKYYELLSNGTMKATEIMKLLDIKKSRFYVLKKEYEAQLQKNN